MLSGRPLLRLEQEVLIRDFADTALDPPLVDATARCSVTSKEFKPLDKPSSKLPLEKNDEPKKNDKQDLEVVKEFAIFGKLPKEIQLKIWKYALPGRRLLKAKLVKLDISVNEVEKVHGIQCQRTGQDNIGMLMACKDSREVTIKNYPYQLPAANGIDDIRFNADDVVEIEGIFKLVLDGDFEKLCTPAIMASDISKIATLVIARGPKGGQVSNLMSEILRQGHFNDFVSLFSSLKTVLLVCGTTRGPGNENRRGMMFGNGYDWSGDDGSFRRLSMSKVYFERSYASYKQIDPMLHEAPEVKVLDKGEPEAEAYSVPFFDDYENIDEEIHEVLVSVDIGDHDTLASRISWKST